jgi:autotransporter-associated beta strand protein
MVKRGGGTLTVIGDSTGFSGTTVLKNGTLTLSGGTDVEASGTTSLGMAQPMVLEGGTLRFLNDSQIAQYNNGITLHGNATIHVAIATTGTGGVIELGALTMGANTLTTTSANGYGLRFVGTTTLGSAISTINATFNPAVGVFNAAGATTLAGLVTGPGALNKIGAGTLFLTDITGGSIVNDYSGGTNVLAGTLAIGDGFTQLGSGRVIVDPGTALRIEDNLNLLSLEGGAPKLFIQSSSAALGVLGLDADFFTPDSPVLSDARISPYGIAVQINSPTTQFSGDFDFTSIGSTLAGNGQVSLGGDGGHGTARVDRPDRGRGGQ